MLMRRELATSSAFSGLLACGDVAGVGAGRIGRVTFDGARVVAEDLGEDRDGAELGELLEGAQAGGPGRAHGLQSSPQVARVDVLARGVTPEDPRAVGVRGGPVLAGIGDQLA